MGKINVYIKTVDAVTIPIISQLRHIRHPNLILWIDEEYRNNKLFLHWKDKHIIEHPLLKPEIVCHEWDVDSCAVLPYINNGMRHVLSRCCTEHVDFIIVDSVSHPKNRITLFRDAPHHADLPDRFFKFPSFCSIDPLLDYCEVNGFLPFTLKDESCFLPATGISPVQGAVVYKEIKTGRYWYRDMLHKNHYEVFDKTGQTHLGEADMDGNLDLSKSDSRKKLR